MSVMGKFWASVKRWVWRVFTLAWLMLGALVVWGCSTPAVMPALVPYGMDLVLQGETPHVKVLGMKVTTQGIVDGRIWILDQMYPVIKEGQRIGQERAVSMSNGLMSLMTAAGFVTTGLAPVLAAKLPKGAVKKEDHEAEVKKALETQV